MTLTPLTPLTPVDPATPVADRILEALGPAMAERAGPLLADLVAGLTSPLAAVDELLNPARSTDTRWAAVFDLTQTPDPDLLGQLAGTPTPPGLDPAAKRAHIAARPGWLRGTPAQILAALSPLLTGYQRVDVLERVTSPWRFTVRVYAPQVPAGVTQAQLAALVEAQKPVGLIATVEIAAGASYAHFAAHHGSTLADVTAAFPTCDSMRTHIPEEGTTA